MAKKESCRKQSPPVPVWEGCSYVRVPEGRYEAIATRYQGPEWARAFSRWSLLVEFDLLGDGSLVCAFYNFGTDPTGPKILRRGNYFKAWTLANGEPPRKREPMSPEVFLEGQVYTIAVGDNQRDSTEKKKAEAEIYSVAREIISVQRRSSYIPNQKSINQLVNKSTNQLIHQSSNQPIRFGHLREKQNFDPNGFKLSDSGAFKEIIAPYQDSPVAGRR